MEASSKSAAGTIGQIREAEGDFQIALKNLNGTTSAAYGIQSTEKSVLQKINFTTIMQAKEQHNANQLLLHLLEQEMIANQQLREAQVAAINLELQRRQTLPLALSYAENARVPVIRHYKGVCHVYVDGEADLDAAVAIAIDAKVRRPGVCNAMETLLVDRACAKQFLPRVAAALCAENVELRGCKETRALVPEAREATDADWAEEYLDLVLAIRVVGGMDEALAHVARHGTNHSEAIVTRSYERARRWQREVDASFVAVNASTRFNDGGELGLGAEIGIATSRLHWRGPMGLEALTTMKWVVDGAGQIRG